MKLLIHLPSFIFYCHFPIPSSKQQPQELLMFAQTQQVFSQLTITTHAVPHFNPPYEVSTLQDTAQVPSLGKLFFLILQSPLYSISECLLQAMHFKCHVRLFVSFVKISFTTSVSTFFKGKPHFLNLWEVLGTHCVLKVLECQGLPMGKRKMLEAVPFMP